MIIDGMGYSKLYYNRSPPWSGIYEYARTFSSYRDSRNRSPHCRRYTYRRDGQDRKYLVMKGAISKGSGLSARWLRIGVTEITND